MRTINLPSPVGLTAPRGWRIVSIRHLSTLGLVIVPFHSADQLLQGHSHILPFDASVCQVVSDGCGRRKNRASAKRAVSNGRRRWKPQRQGVRPHNT